MSRPARRLAILGLDCAAPAIVFDAYADAMPYLSSLRKRGLWGTLRAPCPPITVPSWACMMSGRDPGALGLYGFRNRQRGSYAMSLATAEQFREKAIWDVAGEQGLRSAALFVPPSFPPKPLRGAQLSCFLTPPNSPVWSFPAALGAELESRFGSYLPDLEDFRHRNRADVLGDLFRMTKQHFQMLRCVWEEQAPSLLAFVEIGTDRLHHLFWDQMDATHPQFGEEPKLVQAARDYYAYIDSQIAEFSELLTEEDALMIVSDHGARSMEGAVRINDWLIEEGWLVLRNAPTEASTLRPELVDWSRTRAWAEGGYYARVMLNQKGREEQGIVEPRDARERLEELRRSLCRLGECCGLSVEVHAPESLYESVRGLPPDLFVIFGDLACRATAEVGPLAAQTRDLSPFLQSSSGIGFDVCNHDWNGIFVGTGAGFPVQVEPVSMDGLDIAPTACGLLGLEKPPLLKGRDWTSKEGRRA